MTLHVRHLASQINAVPRTTFTNDKPWAADAACAEVDPDLWYPEKGGYHTGHQAKLICNGDDDRPACPVRDQCLAYAMDPANEINDGIWAGLSSRQRKRLAKKLRDAETAA